MEGACAMSMRESHAGAPSGLEIAVIGMSGRFPQASNIQIFWENLKAGKECITFFSLDELKREGVSEAEALAENYVAAAGAVRDSTFFDAGFFAMTPREAELTDPQNRILLECAWEALEDAGHDPARFPGAIGVFAGKSMSEYLLFALTRAQQALQGMNLFQFFLGNDKDFLATQIAYKLDLRGPCLTVQTACSTSLAAVHLACQSLLSGESEMALAGGVSLRFPAGRGYFYERGGITSPDGHCRAFEARAQGTVPGSGAGIVVLRRLADALAAGDNVRAVIQGSALNNDGLQKVGYTAPSIAGQSEAIRAAYASAGVEPASIDYVETHGTGTSMGDPIEVAALREVFETQHRDAPCYLGAVKANIGHLDAAAGIAGLIKTVLSLEHGELPPTVHFQTPNPALCLDDKLFSVNTRLRPWNSQRPRRAAVSSFGMGGANVHLVVDEAPKVDASASSRKWHVLPLSARSEAALEAAIENLERALTDGTEWSLPDMAFTLQNGRKSFSCRTAIVAASAEEAHQLLGDAVRERRWLAAPANEPGVVFMFPGQGTQHVNMGRELREEYKVFRDALDGCLEIASEQAGCNLFEIIYPAHGAVLDEVEANLRNTAVAQPALFAIEYALAKLWMSWGVMPQAMIGHSIGEYVAACLAGVMDWERATELVAWRGQLMAELPPGAMLAVTLPEEEAGRYLDEEISLAAVNTPRAVVFSGPQSAIGRMEEKFRMRETVCRRLQTSHAFHSRMMEPAMKEFERRMARIPLRPPRIPYISCVTGRWITAEEATSSGYWAAQLRQTVRFSDGLQTAAQHGPSILLEAGVGSALSGMARQSLHNSPSAALSVLSGLPAAEQGRESRSVVETLGKLWMHGINPRWKELSAGESRLRVALPTYPFERKKYSLFKDLASAAPEKNTAAENLNAAAPCPPELRSGAAAYRPPSADEIESGLAEIWQDLLGTSPIRSTDNFFELGGTSLVALDLMARAQRQFGKKLSLNDVVEHPTLAGLARKMRNGQRNATDLPLVCLQNAGIGRPFFLVHPVGGTVFCYQPLAQSLGPDQAVYAFQARSVTEDAGLPRSLEEMAGEYVRKLCSASPPPYLLGGWSLGGVVAFEMARQLQRTGSMVDLLVLMDSHPFLQKELLECEVDVEETIALIQRALREGNGAARDLPPVLARIVRDSGIRAAAAQVDPDHLRRLVRTYMLNIHLLRDYAPLSYNGNASLFCAAEQPEGAQHDLGWRRLISGNLDLITVPGDHHAILQGENVNRIAQSIRERVEALAYSHEQHVQL
jgi:acyl transferase domain-containing protein/thioesterase domain-containing protein